MFLFLLLADEVFQLIGRWELHYDKWTSTLIYLLLLENIPYVAGFDIHLQGAFFLVDNDARGITLLDIVFEFAIGRITRRSSGQEGTVTIQEHIAQSDGNNQIQPRQTYLRPTFLILFIIIVVIHRFSGKSIQIRNTVKVSISPQMLDIVKSTLLR